MQLVKKNEGRNYSVIPSSLWLISVCWHFFCLAIFISVFPKQKIYLCVLKHICAFRDIFVHFEIHLCVLKHTFLYICALHLWGTVKSCSFCSLIQWYFEIFDFWRAVCFKKDGLRVNRGEAWGNKTWKIL